ncbi:DNA-binding GntR family transcriptional regulator [Paraburkholderia bannensis]|uniref:DNA-binding GntR family transcriptional regulator n=1 Tax=Paraburkholderia bannensis TaxID=765414 RepID=A0A7W9U3M7_9BURK|nr:MULTISPECIES: GntR family transcriptional regulator [Paraburkholderia]MBB3260600.1 DNA-binding GntR family transcriptional regulator [Paraburkholderia sp. WP4_3_2]MBB6105636.1 DNA-binding GntR family transcriptional regulator [Paraburkholderia bannensis]
MSNATNGFPLDGPQASSSRTALPGVATPLAPPTSTSHVIANALRTAIVEGTLAPGAPLRQDAIARHFSVSAIPVREALRQLASEGWARIELNKGASVAPLSRDEAREIYEIRSALESLALGLAIPNHTDETLREVSALAASGLHETDPSLYVERNEAFHMSLYAPAGRPQLMEMLRTLHRRGERYLRLKFGFPAYKGESDAEHVEILAAVQRRDIPAAQALVAEHLLGTGELIYRFLTEREAARVDEAARKKRRAGQSTRAAASPVSPAADPASAATPRSRSRTPDEASS